MMFRGLAACCAALWVTTALAAQVLVIQPYFGGDTTLVWEYVQAQSLGLSIDVVSIATFETMTTAQFSTYEALLINPWGNNENALSPYLDFFSRTKAVWGPAIKGNVVLVGGGPASHASRGAAGAAVLIKNAINFAVDGSQTGLYMQMPTTGGDTVDGDALGFLDVFGEFKLRTGQCADASKLVASHPALGTLSDADTSNWSCSIHAVWAQYPVAFTPLAVATQIGGAGLQTFADGTTGVPWIVARGVKPLSCGDGTRTTGEECDDGTNNGEATSLCSSTCTCVYGSDPDPTTQDPVCRDAPRCGDKRIDSGEQCDNGDSANGVGSDNCDASCQCRFGAVTDPNSGAVSCKAEPACGDGEVNTSSEECDAGEDNGASGNLCDATCKCVYGPDTVGCLPEPVCGDGKINTDAEQCDDGENNGDPSSLCTATCTCVFRLSGITNLCAGAATCGDGEVNDAREQCDDGESNGGSGSLCSASCTCLYGPSSSGGCDTAPVCGDGIVGFEEQCDDGSSNGGSSSLCDESCACAYGLDPDSKECLPPHVTTSSIASMMSATVSPSGSPSDPSTQAGSSSALPASTDFPPLPPVPTSSPNDRPGFPPIIANFEFFSCAGSRDGYPTFELVATRDDMDLDLCLSLCDGYTFAGAYDEDCYCGTELNDAETTRVEEAECDIPCPGNEMQFCGGLSGEARTRSLFRRQSVPAGRFLTIYIVIAVDGEVPSIPAPPPPRPSSDAPASSGTAAASADPAASSGAPSASDEAGPTRTRTGAVVTRTATVTSGEVVTGAARTRTAGAVVTASSAPCYTGSCGTVFVILVPWGWEQCEGQLVYVKSCEACASWSWEPLWCRDGACRGRTVYKPDTCVDEACRGYDIVEETPCACEGGKSYVSKDVTGGGGGYGGEKGSADTEGGVSSGGGSGQANGSGSSGGGDQSGGNVVVGDASGQGSKGEGQGEVSKDGHVEVASSYRSVASLRSTITGLGMALLGIRMLL